MRQPTATVSSDYLRMVASSAEARGLDIAPLFAASGIDPRILGRRGERVGVAAVMDAFKRTTRRLDDPLFALTVSEAIPPGFMTMIDYLVLSSADVGGALDRVARYAPLMSDGERLTQTVDGNEARFRLEDGNDNFHGVEMVMGLFARRARQIFGPDWSLRRVCFTHPSLGPKAIYDRIFQAPVLFETPFNEVVFARDLTTMHMAGADARLNALFVAEAETALAAIAPPAGAPSFINTVKRVLENGLYERDLTLTRLADQLGVSTRTLQRRLRAAGVTHRGLVRSVRQDVATRSLATGVSQGRIAHTLGYSGAGAFQRAFKGWSGMTPGQLRRRRRRKQP